MKWIKIGRIAVIGLAINAFSAIGSYAESPDVVERHVKSAFIYQFTKYITWPKNDSDFLVSVIGDEELTKVLSNVMDGKSVGDRPIVVESSAWTNPALANSAVLVFPKKVSPSFKSIIEKLKTKPCLIVSHSDGMATAGTTINFFMVDNKMKWELNQRVLKEKSLTISDALLKLAKIVD